MIFPFKGHRYSKKAGSLEQLIAPPYDVIGTELRKILVKRSEYNIVHLTLPESFEQNYHKEIAEKLENWCKNGILVQDEDENFYVIKQKFIYKGKNFERTGFIGLFDLTQSEKIIKHEIIFNKYRDDRIKLLDATKSNLEPIFLLYEDKEFLLEKLIKSVSFQAKIKFDDQLIEMENVKLDTLSPLIEKIKKMPLFIADGHHRFQASFEYFQKSHDSAPRFIMVYLTNIVSDSLLSLPTHRAIRAGTVEEKISEINDFFEIRDMKDLNDTMEHIEKTDVCAFGFYSQKKFQLWTLKQKEMIKKFLPETYSDDWKSFDVVILHYFVLKKFFNIDEKEKLFYDRDCQSIIDYVDKNPGSAGFFLKTPDLQKIKNISLNGEILPPKSTFFYPKVPSGLVIARYV